MRTRQPSIPEFKIVVIGGRRSGKSALVQRFVYRVFVENFEPTIDESPVRLFTLDNVPVRADILDADTIDHENCAHSPRRLVPLADGVVLTYSIASRASLAEAFQIGKELARAREWAGSDGFPLVLVGCLADLGEGEERRVTEAEGRAAAKAAGAQLFFEASAKTGVNVDEAFHALARCVRDERAAKGEDRVGVGVEHPQGVFETSANHSNGSIATERNRAGNIEDVEPLRKDKIGVYGGRRSGKTALIRRFVKNYFNDTYNPTTESTSDKLFYLDEELATMEILEAPPQEEYAPLREQCARACDGLLLVYSVTSRVSFEAALALQAEVVRARREANRFPLVLVGSKRDLGAERRVSESEGRAAAAAMGGCPFYEASARWEAFFIEDAFHSLVRSVRDGKAAKERLGRLGYSTRGRSAKCVLL